ncbi:MAG: hypothetical protein A4E34_01466 [Methanoregula sp. PtaU1.Bin006]|nr:MAG: hypothetical protein A4E34_01466 [Methanoregula sp. PtaU1.Bin006]
MTIKWIRLGIIGICWIPFFYAIYFVIITGEWKSAIKMVVGYLTLGSALSYYFYNYDRQVT